MDYSFLKDVLAASIPCFAVYLGIQRYMLKSGIYLRGEFSISSSSFCESSYVSRVAIENLKDKSVSIFAIYIKIYPNYYILIEDFERDPVILKPFETIKREYEPLDFYGLNSKKVRAGDLLDRRKNKIRLVISTSQGKYTIRKSIRRWNPVMMVFRNHMTGLIRPIRYRFEGKSYGSNAKYIIQFTTSSGDLNLIPVYKEDYNIKKFKNFSLSKESLDSRSNLEALLNEKRTEGILSVESIKVHDLSEMKQGMDDLYDPEPIELSKVGWIHYYVLGPIVTRLSDLKLKRENLAREKSPEKKGTMPLP